MIRNLSIRLKVFATIALIVAGIVIFQLAFFPERQIELLTQAAEGKAVSLTRLVAHDVRPAVEFDDREQAQEVLSGATEDPQVAFVAVYRHTGELFASQDPKRIASRFPPSSTSALSVTTQDDLLLVSSPVALKTAPAGTLVLGLSLDDIRTESASIRMTTLIIGIVILAIGFLAAWLFGTLLGRRLSRLGHVAERVAAGDLSLPQLDDDSDDEIGRLGNLFSRMVTSLVVLQQHVQEVSAGDLSRTTDLPGDLAAAFNRMILAQRELVSQINETAVQLNAAAGEFLANAKQQERGATEQSSAVEETRRTMTTLQGSADQIARAAQDVLENAERAQQNSQIVAERIATLSAHTQRITEILEVIKDIANKSDLLALNAALEGAKAGEAGRGFSLVASQMQRLAESVMRAVGDIKELTGTIVKATQSTVMATELSTKLVGETTRSARQITLSSQQQQSGAELATTAMNDVAEVAFQTAAGSKQIVSSATDLMSHSVRLQGLVGRFRLGGAVERPTMLSEQGEKESA